jgi:hypothetical protein
MAGGAITMAGVGGVSMNGIVKGAPYSADTSTEHVQTLPDGNRIVASSAAKVYRDSQGRTRIDQTASPAGAWVPEGAQSPTTSIDDPVAGEHIMLNGANKIAIRFQLKTLSVSSDAMKVKLDKVQAEQAATMAFTVTSGDAAVPPPPPPPPPSPDAPNAFFFKRVAEAGAAAKSPFNAKSESLDSIDPRGSGHGHPGDHDDSGRFDWQ